MDPVTVHTLKRLNSEGLALLRNVHLGGAAASLAILLQLLQIPTPDAALRNAVLCTAIALPLFIAGAAALEILLFVGREGLQVYRLPLVHLTLELSQAIAVAALVGAVLVCLWHLSQLAAVMFLFVSALGLAVGVLVYWQIDHALKSVSRS